MTPEEARIARTETVFRHVNERIAETAHRFGSPDAEFVCECANPECHHRLDATLSEYERVREDATTFLVAEGHEQPDHEQVLEQHRDYFVIRKIGRALAGAVRRTNPRANPA